MAQNTKPSIQTCWHVLSFSFFRSLPLFSSPLFNPHLLEERLVNPWLVSVNAAYSRLRLRELATPVRVCADLLCLKPFFPLCLNFSTLELSMASLSVSLTTIGVDSSFSSHQDLLVFHTCSFLSPLVWQTDRPAPRPRHSRCPTSFTALIDTSYTHARTPTQTYCRCLLTWIVLALPLFELLVRQSLLFACWMQTVASLRHSGCVCVCVCVCVCHHGATLSFCLFNGTFVLRCVATYCLSHLTCLSCYEDLRKWRK